MLTWRQLQLYQAIQRYHKSHTKIKVNKVHILWCMCSKFCVTSQRCHSKFLTRFWNHIPQNIYLRCVKSLTNFMISSLQTEGFFYWIRVFIHVLYITQVFAAYFSSQINLLSNSFFSYTKYFVLTFSIDIVSTLSNQSYGILSLGEIGPRQNSAGKVGYSASTLTPFFMSSTQIWRFLTLRFVTGRHCTINSKLFGACWNTGGVPPTTIFNPLNHKAWWPTHASVNSVIIGTGNRQYSVGPLGINCTYILMEIHKWPFKKYKIPPAK